MFSEDLDLMCEDCGNRDKCEECTNVPRKSNSDVQAVEPEKDKYGWHDLRKKPDDVPDTDRKVECRTMTMKGVVNPVFGYFSGDRWCCGMNANVIAWREIEPFEVEE